MSVHLAVDPAFGLPPELEPPRPTDEPLVRAYLDALRTDDEMAHEHGPVTIEAVTRLAADWLRRTDLARSGQWGILEVLGHTKLAGKIREVEQFGVRWIEVEVPAYAVAGYHYSSDVPFFVPAHEAPAYSRLFRPQALFSTRLVSEVEARGVARSLHHERPPYAKPAPIPLPEHLPGMQFIDDEGETREITNPPEETEPRPWVVWFAPVPGDSYDGPRFVHRNCIVALLDAEGNLVWGERPESREPDVEYPW